MAIESAKANPATWLRTVSFKDSNDNDVIVYGGSINVATGVLKARPYYESYAGETLVGPWVSDRDVYSAGATPTTGAFVVDMGGPETTYQLTPEQLNTALGENKIESIGNPVINIDPASVATFESEQSGLNVYDLVVSIDPVQAGSGDPSPENVRPITGWTGANVYHSGADTADYETVSVAWTDEAGTVYGGTLDVTTGVLTVTHGYVDLGTLSWIRTTSYAHPFFYVQKSDYKIRTNVMCSGFAPMGPKIASSFGSDAADLAVAGGYDNSQIYVRYDAYSDAASFKSAVSGVVLVYQFATPVTYQLTTTQVNLLLGENNVWADTGNIKKLAYPTADQSVGLISAAYSGTLVPTTTLTPDNGEGGHYEYTVESNTYTQETESAPHHWYVVEMPPDGLTVHEFADPGGGA